MNNITLYRDGLHAHSLDTKGGPERDWVKAFHASIDSDIPENWRICGENLYAKHSIQYHDLPSYFMGFSVWNEYNVCLLWDETIECLNLIEITPVPVHYDGIYDERAIRKLYDSQKDWE